MKSYGNPVRLFHVVSVELYGGFPLSSTSSLVQPADTGSPGSLSRFSWAARRPFSKRLPFGCRCQRSQGRRFFVLRNPTKAKGPTGTNRWAWENTTLDKTTLWKTIAKARKKQVQPPRPAGANGFSPAQRCLGSPGTNRSADARLHPGRTAKGHT